MYGGHFDLVFFLLLALPQRPFAWFSHRGTGPVLGGLPKPPFLLFKALMWYYRCGRNDYLHVPFPFPCILSNSYLSSGSGAFRRHFWFLFEKCCRTVWSRAPETLHGPICRSEALRYHFWFLCEKCCRMVGSRAPGTLCEPSCDLPLFDLKTL